MVVDVVRKVVLVLNYFFAGYLVVYATYLIISNIFGSIKMYRNRRLEQLHNVLEHDFYYPISILVPAYNEGETVIQTVKNLLKLEYRLYEIVVVDDGSKDNTKQLLIDNFSLRQEVGRPIRYAVPCKKIREIYSGKVNNIRIIMISKDNGGSKADAINAAINVATYPYFVNMDGDEILQKDALKYACRAILESDNVIGVGGNLKISNDVEFYDAMPVAAGLGKNLIVNMQVLEYGRGFVGAKIFQNILNANLIISGGYGIFQKSAVIEVGGYDTSSKGEDMELTLRLHHHYRKNKKKYSMKYVPDSVCWTQGPANFRDLRKQRERWSCGLIQTISKYKCMILNPKYGIIGMFMLPYTIMYELLNPILMIVGWIVILWSAFDKTLNFPFVLYLYLMYVCFGIILTTISFLDKTYMKKDFFSLLDVVKCLLMGVVEAFFFRPYLALVGLVSYFKYKKIAEGAWFSPERVKTKSLDDD